MSNNEKTIRMMHAKILLSDDLDKFLSSLCKVGKAMNMGAAEFTCAFFMDLLSAVLMAARDAGTRVDLEGYCKALKAEVYGDDE